MTIDRKEVLQYVGYRGQEIDSATEQLLEESIRICLSAVKERYVYREFELERTETGLFLAGTTFQLPGNHIASHLAGCDRCFLMGVTLGAELDRQIRIAQEIEMTKAVLLDACGAAAVEQLCDAACREMGAGKKLTSRFSPGYGDFPLSVQPQFLKILDAGRKLGLTVTSNDIMLPRKSVTAVVGINKA